MFATFSRDLRRRYRKKKQVPVRLRSGQAFDSAEVRFAQDDSICGEVNEKQKQVLREPTYAEVPKACGFPNPKFILR
jgi:hypothetical protein